MGHYKRNGYDPKQPKKATDSKRAYRSETKEARCSCCGAWLRLGKGIIGRACPKCGEPLSSAIPS